MTLQETFDRVAAHLHTQGGPALSAEGKCVYRAPDGRRCAAGVLIPDTDYDEGMEGRGLNGPLFRVLTREGHNIKLVQDLQEVHDSSVSFTDPAEWVQIVERWIEGVAERHRLVYRAL